MQFYIYGSLTKDETKPTTKEDLITVLSKEKNVLLLKKEDLIQFNDAIELKKYCENNPYHVLSKKNWDKVSHIFSVDINPQEGLLENHTSVNIEPNISTRFLEVYTADAKKLINVINQAYPAPNEHRLFAKSIIEKPVQELDCLHKKNLLIKYFRNELSGGSQKEIESNRAYLLDDISKSIDSNEFEGLLMESRDELQKINKRSKKQPIDKPYLEKKVEGKEVFTVICVPKHTSKDKIKPTIERNPEIAKNAIEYVRAKFEAEENKKAPNVIQKLFYYCISLLPFAFCKNYYNKKQNEFAKKQLFSTEQCFAKLLPEAGDAKSQVVNIDVKPSNENANKTSEKVEKAFFDTCKSTNVPDSYKVSVQENEQVRVRFDQQRTSVRQCK